MMKLGKKELIISIVMLIVFVVIGLNVSVFATSSTNTVSLNNGFSFNLTNNSNTIPTNNTATNNIEKDQEIPTNNTVIPTNNANVNNANTNNASTKDVPNTGLEDMPWLVIAVCGVSAIFAFKKIKEYNEV